MAECLVAIATILSKTFKIDFLFMSVIVHNWSFFAIFKLTFWSLSAYRAHSTADSVAQAKHGHTPLIRYTSSSFRTPYRAHSPAYPAAMQIYWNKGKCLHKKRAELWNFPLCPWGREEGWRAREGGGLGFFVEKCCLYAELLFLACPWRHHFLEYITNTHVQHTQTDTNR